MNDLSRSVVRGGVARVCAVAANTLLRIGSMMLLARLLEPTDFGLLGMVTALTGILSLFRDFGLSVAAVQRATVTDEQSSTLFWTNVAVGALLTILTVALAPVIRLFYGEPRLLAITSVVALGFLFNSGGIQHSAILQRQMRFTALATIDIVAQTVSTGSAILMAIGGMGYWSLVALGIIYPLVYSAGCCFATRWVPGRPRRGIGLRSMLRFGGTVTLNGVVLYVAFNLDKVLLGRFWGSQVLGFYGRAYQLIRIPTDTLNTTVGEVAFSALSRIQDDPLRLRRYFLRGYSLVLSCAVPVTLACACFAEDVTTVLLGAKWKPAAQTFRLLAPAILVFAVSNPLGWLLNALGLVGRGLKIALVLAPIMLLAYLIGLRGGAQGVALASSTAMVLWVVPTLAWSVQGTAISLRDILLTAGRPLASGVGAAAVASWVQYSYGHLFGPLVRLILDTGVLFLVYGALLLFVAGQKDLVLDLIRVWKGKAAAADEPTPAPV